MGELYDVDQPTYQTVHVAPITGAPLSPEQILWNEASRVPDLSADLADDWKSTITEEWIVPLSQVFDSAEAWWNSLERQKKRSDYEKSGPTSEVRTLKSIPELATDIPGVDLREAAKDLLTVADPSGLWEDVYNWGRYGTEQIITGQSPPLEKTVPTFIKRQVEGTLPVQIGTKLAKVGTNVKEALTNPKQVMASDLITKPDTLTLESVKEKTDAIKSNPEPDLQYSGKPTLDSLLAKANETEVGRRISDILQTAKTGAYGTGVAAITAKLAPIVGAAAAPGLAALIKSQISQRQVVNAINAQTRAEAKQRAIDAMAAKGAAESTKLAELTKAHQDAQQAIIDRDLAAGGVSGTNPSTVVESVTTDPVVPSTTVVDNTQAVTDLQTQIKEQNELINQLLKAAAAGAAGGFMREIIHDTRDSNSPKKVAAVGGGGGLVVKRVKDGGSKPKKGSVPPRKKRKR